MNGASRDHQDERRLQRAPKSRADRPGARRAGDVYVRQHLREQPRQIGAPDDGASDSRLAAPPSPPSPPAESTRIAAALNTRWSGLSRTVTGLDAAQRNRRHHPGEQSELGPEIVAGPVQAESPEPDERPAHRQHANHQHERGKREHQHRYPADRRHPSPSSPRSGLPDTLRPERFSPKTKSSGRVEQPDFPEQPEGRADDDESAAVDEAGEQELARSERQQRAPLRLGCSTARSAAVGSRPARPCARQTRARASPRAPATGARACALRLIAAAGLDPDLDDPQQPMQEVLDRVDVLDPAVRHVPLVPEDEAARDDELVRIEAVAERQRRMIATIAKG